MSFTQNSHSIYGNQLGVFPLPKVEKRDPLSSDSNYELCQLWLNKATKDLFMLVEKNVGLGVAVWQLIGAGGGDLKTLTGDSGGAITGLANNINLVGSELIETVGTPPNEIEFRIKDATSDGDVIIGANGAQSEYGSLTSTGSTIDITPNVSTPGSYTINFEVAAGVATNYTPSEGTSPVSPVSNNLNLTAGTNIRTIGSAGTVTFQLVDDVNTTSYSTEAGPSDEYVEWSANLFTASNSAGTGDVDIDLIPQDGGAVRSFTTFNAATPIPVASGGTEVNSWTTYAVVCGGTTSTAPLQNVSGVGTSGQVLTSNGAAALPTWQDAAASFLPVVIGTGIGTNLSFQTAYWDEMSTHFQVPGFPAAGDIGKIIEVTCADSGGGTRVQDSLATQEIIYNGTAYTRAIAVAGGTITLRFISTGPPPTYQVINVTGNWDFT